MRRDVPAPAPTSQESAAYLGSALGREILQTRSAALLCGMPVVFGLVLWFMKPEYIDVLVNDSTGSKFFIYAICSEIAGILVIRKMSSPKI